MAKVVVLKCDTYEYTQVKEAVARGIALLGGPTAFAQAGERILLKPNLLAAAAPEQCATTHPAVFRAVCELFNSSGVELSYGDSPAYHSPEAAAYKSGLAEAAAEWNIPLADFVRGQEVFVPEALQNRKFTIANGVLASDGLISLPKLKTHGLMKLTGALKNQFGCIPGILKSEFHVKLPQTVDFARMLADLNIFLKPRLYIMDGIMAMEGNGPRNGSPRKMNVLLFSTDPVALDATICRLVQVDPELSPTIIAGSEAGLGVFREEEIELLGEPLAQFQVSNFQVNTEPIKSYPRLGKAARILTWLLVPKPVIRGEKCVRCGICVKMCPVKPKAIDWHNESSRKNPPSYQYKRCIRCFCCQEVCPAGAIEIKKPLFRKLFAQKQR